MRFRVLANIPDEKYVDIVKPDIREKTWFSDIKKYAVSDREDICVDARHIKHKYIIPLVLAFFKHHFMIGKYKTDSQYKRNMIVIVVKNKSIAQEIKHRLRCQWFGNRLASEPANKLYPDLFCKAVQKKFANIPNTHVTIWDEKELKRRNFGLVLAVGNSSRTHPPRFIMIKIGPPKQPNVKTIVAVGKGVVFDSGGYNLKAGSSMLNMNGDKTGGAVAVSLATYFGIEAPEKLPPRTRLIICVPLVENLIGQNAQKIGDIHTAYNGKTVEILNTDAEGRLILADVLAFVSHVYKPDFLMDFATLTGWANTLHCDTSYVYYTENNALASSIDHYGNKVGERSIRLPPWPEYMENVKSNIADLKNAMFTKCTKSDGFMATMFLAHFVSNRHSWIHFDLTHVTNDYGMNMCNCLQTAIELITHFKTTMISDR